MFRVFLTFIALVVSFVAGQLAIFISMEKCYPVTFMCLREEIAHRKRKRQGDHEKGIPDGVHKIRR